MELKLDTSSLENLSLDAVVNKVAAELDVLLKSQKEALSEELKKSEDKKEEDKAKLKKDEEDSHYENQAPEVEESAAQQPDDQAEQKPDDQAEQPEENQEEPDAAALVADLSDEDLHELAQAIADELEHRSAPQDDAEVAPQEPEMAEKAEDDKDDKEDDKDDKEEAKKDDKEEVAKSEATKVEGEIEKLKAESEDLKKSLAAALGLVETLATRPVRKSLDGINYAARGDDNLKKSEVKPEDVHTKIVGISKDQSKLASLTKAELNVMSDYFRNKVINEDVLKLFNK